MIRQRSRARRREQQELDITAFMNLMVILVPFLLITAVFSRLAILELSVPEAGEGNSVAEERFALEVIVRADAIEVGARDAGLLTVLPRELDAEYDYRALNVFLQRIKAEEPDLRAATVLLEPEINYDVLVAVMDAVRLFTVDGSAETTRAELFPDIAIGDAPTRTQGG